MSNSTKGKTMNNRIQNQRRKKLLRAMAAQYRTQATTRPHCSLQGEISNRPLLPLRYAVAARILELHPEAINMTWGEAADSGLTKNTSGTSI